MGKEWVRLTPPYELAVEGVMTYRRGGDGPLRPHTMRYTDGIGDEYDWWELSDAEALAFARLLPEVRALVDAARGVLSEVSDDPGVMLDVGVWDISGHDLLRLCTALAALGADDDPDRPLEGDEFQSWHDEPGYCG